MTALKGGVVGSRHVSQSITWKDEAGAVVDLTGATITGFKRATSTGTVTALDGTFALAADPTTGVFTWTYGSVDVSTAGIFEVQFTATYSGSGFERTLKQTWPVREVLTASAATEYTAPTGFTYDNSNYYIVDDGDGTFSAYGTDNTPLNLAQLRTWGKEYWVDVTTGSDANAGTSAAAPLKRLNTAIDKSDVVIIHIAPGHYDVTNGTDGSFQNKSISIIKNGTGTVTISRADRTQTWVNDVTLTNTWKITLASTYTVLDASTTDGDGDYSELTLQASAAAVDAAAGSWYLDGSNVLWVRTADDREPDSNIWPLVVSENLWFNGEHTIYLEGLEVIGGHTAGAAFRVENSGAGQAVKVYVKDCSFKFSGLHGAFLRGVSEAIFDGCTCTKNKSDGFTYVALNTVVTNVTEIDCTSNKNGTNDAQDNDNGSSMHGGGSAVRLNGTYNQNIGPNVVDVSTSFSWNLNCTANNSAGDAGQGVGFHVDGEMWLDSCTASGNFDDVVAQAAGDVLRTRNTTYTTTGGTGTITTY